MQTFSFGNWMDGVSATALHTCPKVLLSASGVVLSQQILPALFKVMQCTFRKADWQSVRHRCLQQLSAAPMTECSLHGIYADAPPPLPLRLTAGLLPPLLLPRRPLPTLSPLMLLLRLRVIVGTSSTPHRAATASRARQHACLIRFIRWLVKHASHRARAPEVRGTRKAADTMAHSRRPSTHSSCQVVNTTSTPTPSSAQRSRCTWAQQDSKHSCVKRHDVSVAVTVMAQ
jgi:hypothetical protein